MPNCRYPPYNIIWTLLAYRNTPIIFLLWLQYRKSSQNKNNMTDLEGSLPPPNEPINCTNVWLKCLCLLWSWIEVKVGSKWKLKSDTHLHSLLTSLLQAEILLASTVSHTKYFRNCCGHDPEAPTETLPTQVTLEFHHIILVSTNMYAIYWIGAMKATGKKTGGWGLSGWSL